MQLLILYTESIHWLLRKQTLNDAIHAHLPASRHVALIQGLTACVIILASSATQDS